MIGAKPVTVAVALCLVCVIVLTTQSRAQPTTAQQAGPNDPLAIAGDGWMYLGGSECGPDEELRPGAVPSCEPTCARPRPMCIKMFYSSLDHVPCFCKSPLVRNEVTKQCVPLSECPPQTEKLNSISST